MAGGEDHDGFSCFMRKKTLLPKHTYACSHVEQTYSAVITARCPTRRRRGSPVTTSQVGRCRGQGPEGPAGCVCDSALAALATFVAAVLGRPRPLKVNGGTGHAVKAGLLQRPRFCCWLLVFTCCVCVLVMMVVFFSFGGAFGLRYVGAQSSGLRNALLDFCMPPSEAFEIATQ